MLTPTEAAAFPCPVARTFAEATPNCRGPACILWRWEKLTTAHPKWLTAVRAVAEQIGDRPPYPKASRIVADDKAAHGITVERGWCGMGGEP